MGYLDNAGATFLIAKIKDLLSGKVNKEEGKSLTDVNFTQILKAKLDGIADGANKYSHPMTSGNKHIPAGGKSGQILRWSEDGTAVWGDDKDTTYVSATQTTAGLMSPVDKKKLDAFGAETEYAKKTDITGMYQFKGSIETEDKLPTTGLKTGDVYNIESASSYGAAGQNVAWTGKAWDSLGSILKIEAITIAEIDAMFS